MEDTPAHPTTLDLEPWRKLLHRWFIQYNPLYLVSAALVLVGVILSSRGLAGGGTLAQLGISAIAEVYAWTLIGGAALLVRIHLRRPAVMLALLAALYQCDLTLHTATCAHLGVIGMLGSIGWFVGFVAKLHALAWAIRLRVSRSAAAVTGLGAAMITLFPWLLRELDGETASALLGLGLFVLFEAGLWTSCRVESRTAESGWAAIVARRSIRATWLGWATMMLVHVGFWLSQHPQLHASALVPAGLLLSTRLAKREHSAWLVVLGTLGYIAVVAPQLSSLTASMGAITLAVRALRRPSVRRALAPASAPTLAVDVYRVDTMAEPSLPPPPALPAFVVVAPGERLRLLSGAAACLYLAVWTQGWAGGPAPSHLGWLDALSLMASLVAFARTRSYAVFMTPGLASLHWIASQSFIRGPHSALEWGATCIGSGFALLLLSLMASVRWRQRSVAWKRAALEEGPCA